MKLLHTADWHLGKHLEGYSRIEEQEAFVDELIEIADDNDIDMILISGDIYDTFNPPAEAEKLFYRALKGLARDGERVICIISGNHDSPNRLIAPSPITYSQGIIIMDKPGFNITRDRVGKHKIVEGGAGYIEFAINNERVVLLALPYPSESRLNQVLGEIKDERVHQQGYSEKVGEMFAELEQHYREDTINIAMSHLFVAGGLESKSERPIQVGGGLTVSRDHLPINSQYTALGHLHRCQTACSERNAYYAGSPLQYSSSERNHAKSVSIVELKPGEKAKIERINLKNRKPIEVWVVEGVEQAFQKCKDNQEREVWAYLKIKTDNPLLQSDIKKIRTIKKDILSIIPLTSEEFAQEKQEELMEELDIKELFKEYYQRTKERTPGEEVMNMFFRILKDKEGQDETEIA